MTLVGEVIDSASRRNTAVNTANNSVANSLAGSAVNSQSNMRNFMDDSIVSEASVNSLASAVSSAATISVNLTNKIGSIRETKCTEYVDYEIYLGDELKDGQVSLEMVGYSTLVVRVACSDWDKSGDYNLELKRQIKVAVGADLQHTQHGVDPVSKILLIKVPFKSV